MIALALLGAATAFLLRWSQWGTHVFAIGANERAAVLTGIAVPWVKISVYVFSSLMAGITGILEAGWLGGVTTNLGQSMELAVIAAAVIGGANLLGGSGTVLGAIVGAALIEIIRNSLILLGISTFWQGAFVGFLLHPGRRLRQAARPEVHPVLDRSGPAPRHRRRPPDSIG